MPAGQTVALVGAMGSGKTALVSLLPRLYDVTEARSTIDGADVRSVDARSLRSAIAVVNDDPFLFSATVHENIAYARAGRDARGGRARPPRAAQADGSSSGCPNGYDTRVGERGLTLSGGQRQRIAIARAILADPRILILDDATSSVDASTEPEIKPALREVMAGRTTFVIAHRLRRSRSPTRSSCSSTAASTADGTARRAARELGALPRDRRAAACPTRCS